jgi:hypothetical protein
MKMILLLAMIAGGHAAFAAPAQPQCDPVWEIARPIYRTVKGKRVLTGWYCEVRTPNGGPSTGGGQNGGG